MTTPGSNITHSTIYQNFQSTRDSINSLIVWSASSNPFNPGASNDYGSNSPAQGSASGEATGDLSQGLTDINVIASTIVSQFESYSVALSRIRYCQLTRWYNNNGNQGITYRDTEVTSTGRTDFQASMSGVDTSNVVAAQNVIASNIDQFVTNLSNAIASNRNNTLSFNEYYCHSSCHGSCHGSI